MITKYNNPNFVCLDEIEARLEIEVMQAQKGEGNICNTI